MTYDASTWSRVRSLVFIEKDCLKENGIEFYSLGGDLSLRSDFGGYMTGMRKASVKWARRGGEETIEGDSLGRLGGRKVGADGRSMARI